MSKYYEEHMILTQWNDVLDSTLQIILWNKGCTLLYVLCVLTLIEDRLH